MRRLFTTADAEASDLSFHALVWGVRTGSLTRIVRGVYGEGPEPPSPLDVERATVLARATVARGALGGVLLGLDAVRLDGRPTRARMTEVAHVVAGVPCASAREVLIDLAATVDDDTWEQQLESALRTRLVSVDELDAVLPELERQRLPGVSRIRRVLARRSPGAPPTESLLETIGLQLARTVPELGEATRQLVVRSPSGVFIARIDLSFPEREVFFELDGQHHDGQPVYDARRETAVVAATGWLPGRFTWDELTRIPRSSARRMGEIARQAMRRAAYVTPTPTAEPMA